MRKLLFLQIFVVLFSFFCLSNSWSAESITVMGFSGEVHITMPGGDKVLPCEEGMLLGEGYGIKTGNGSYLEIAFNEDADNIVKIEDNSNVILILGNEDKIDLIDGEVLAVLKNLKKGQEFKIKTPCATCGARGTAWRTVTDGLKTDVFVFDGEIGLRGIDKTGKLMKEEVMVKKGFERRVNKFSVPEKAIKIAEDRFKEGNKEVQNVFEKRTEFLKRTAIRMKNIVPLSEKGVNDRFNEADKQAIIDKQDRALNIDRRAVLQEKQEALSDKAERMVQMQDRIERRENIIEKGEQVVETQRDMVVKRKIDERIKKIRRRKILTPPPSNE